MIRFKLNAKTEALRQELVTWLHNNPPPVFGERPSLDTFVKVSSDWQRKLAGERWVAVHWPEQYGGRGLSLVEEAVVQETLAENGSPQLINLFGITMVGPVLIEYGNEIQKKRFLAKILNAEELWCQGFSEPGAGSDLAALATTADKKSDHWILNGQKVWTSFAQYANWCFVLARSDRSAAKHKGLSYFLVPMTADGISVRPLKQISGDSEFNEIFFENTPAQFEDLVGDEGQGWRIAISTLMYERVILTFARHLQSEEALTEIAELLKARGSSQISLTKFGELLSQSMAVRALALAHLSEYATGVKPGPEGSMDKLFWSETFQQISSFALELLGPEGLLFSGTDSIAEGSIPHRYLYSKGRTIAAGTSEIQRAIIAERVLGLPKE